MTTVCSQAADLAEEATLEWLKGLKEVRQSEEFGRYLGLSKSSSVCFVIDTTGSMGKDIDAVKQVTQTITELTEESAFPPSDYVLALFNDPGRELTCM